MPAVAVTDVDNLFGAYEITETLAAHDRAHPESPAAPFAVNQIVHKSNARLDEDMELTVKWKAPIVITAWKVPPMWSAGSGS